MNNVTTAFVDVLNKEIEQLEEENKRLKKCGNCRHWSHPDRECSELSVTAERFWWCEKWELLKG